MHRIHSDELDLDEKRALWDEILADYDKSNLSASAFCRKHKIKLQNFTYHKIKYDKNKLRKFIPVGDHTEIDTLEIKRVIVATGKLTIHLPVDLEPYELAKIIKGVTMGC